MYFQEQELENNQKPYFIASKSCASTVSFLQMIDPHLQSQDSVIVGLSLRIKGDLQKKSLSPVFSENERNKSE